jgi:hypothetical protein
MNYFSAILLLIAPFGGATIPPPGAAADSSPRISTRPVCQRLMPRADYVLFMLVLIVVPLLIAFISVVVPHAGNAEASLATIGRA